MRFVELIFEPGTGFNYSSIGYNLLVCIAENVTKESYDNLLKKRIFDPLNISNTHHYNNKKIEYGLATGTVAFHLLGSSF